MLPHPNYVINHYAYDFICSSLVNKLADMKSLIRVNSTEDHARRDTESMFRITSSTAGKTVYVYPRCDNNQTVVVSGYADQTSHFPQKWYQVLSGVSINCLANPTRHESLATNKYIKGWVMTISTLWREYHRHNTPQRGFALESIPLRETVLQVPQKEQM